MRNAIEISPNVKAGALDGVRMKDGDVRTSFTLCMASGCACVVEQARGRAKNVLRHYNASEFRLFAAAARETVRNGDLPDFGAVLEKLGVAKRPLMTARRYSESAQELRHDAEWAVQCMNETALLPGNDGGDIVFRDWYGPYSGKVEAARDGAGGLVVRAELADGGIRPGELAFSKGALRDLATALFAFHASRLGYVTPWFELLAEWAKDPGKTFGGELGNEERKLLKRVHPLAPYTADNENFEG